MEKIFGTLVGALVFGVLWYFVNINNRERDELKKETGLMTALFILAYYFLSGLW